MSRGDGFSRKSSGGSRQGGPRKSSSTRGNAPIGSSAKPKTSSNKPKAESTDIRLNKYIANAGICSRREADVLIQTGAVKVNGVVVDSMGYKVQPGDVVQFDGNTITPEKKVYVLLNKPKAYTTAMQSTQNSKSVMELVRQTKGISIKPVGRMDATSTGLLLLTNDDSMIKKLENPLQRAPKIYQVSLDKNLKSDDMERIQKGVTVNNLRIWVDEISYVDNQPHTEIGLKITHPSVKAVREIFESLQYNVIKIDRVYLAGLTKKNLSRGDWRFLTEQEVINLKNL